MKKFSVYYWFRVLFNHTAIVVCERISAFILVVFSPHIVNTPILHKSYTLPTASHQSQQTRFLHTTSRNLSHPAVISIIIIITVTVITFKLVNGGVKWNKSTCALEAEEEKINHPRVGRVVLEAVHSRKLWIDWRNDIFVNENLCFVCLKQLHVNLLWM